MAVKPLECCGAIPPWEENLYDRQILEDIKLENWDKVSFGPKLSVENPGEGLFLRPLRRSDFTRGYPKLLEQLTVVGNMTEGQFRDAVGKMKRTPDTYYVTVIEDVNTGDVIGTATLLMEQKIIRNCGLRARVEDVVVSDEYRGKQLGKYLLVVLTLLAKKLGSYKISLDCKDSMRPFYESIGYTKEDASGNSLVIRY